MKKKEMKNLAAKIAKCERIIMLNEDPKAVRQAEEEIMRISSIYRQFVLVFDKRECFC